VLPEEGGAEEKQVGRRRTRRGWRSRRKGGRRGGRRTRCAGGRDDGDEGEGVGADGDGLDPEAAAVGLAPLGEAGGRLLEGDDGEGDAFEGEEYAAELPVAQVGGDEDAALAALAGGGDVLEALPFLNEAADFPGGARVQ